MGLTIPTYQDLVDIAISNYETALGQDAPITPKAFLRVLARVQALHVIGLYKLAAERALQNLALTATDEDLERLGTEYGVTRQDAIPAELVITCTGTNGTDIPAGTVFVGDSNGLLYYTQALVTISLGTASPTVTCYFAGVDGELTVSDTLTITSPITGINSSATVASISVSGVDQEDIEVYRRQVQDEIQTVGGGSNLADFRIWAQKTPGIVRAFPYAGAPITTRLIDGDMEKAGVADWSAEGTATLSKETGTPYEGTQCLRIVRGGAVGYAGQEVFKQYNKYNITGVARGDGNCYPVLCCGTHVLWTGTTSTSWQSFDVTFTEGETGTDTTSIELGCLGGSSSSHYVEFDDVAVYVIEYPGQVSVYVECDATIESDGISDSALLSDVRDYINTDQVTGIANPNLGVIDDNLYVEPISRTGFYVEIRGLSIATELETQAKSDLEDEIDAYLRNATPYIQGLDSQSSQADQITDPLISKVVQDVLDSYGATCSGIGIGTTPGVFIASYSLGAGELAKLASSGISYV